MSLAPQEVIDLPVDDIPLCAKFEENFRIGDGLSTVTSIGFDRLGNIRIGDFSPNGGLRVIVANPDGEQSEFGREGSGPGELAMATQIVVMADGRTIVPDPVRGVLDVFLPDGQFDRQVRFDHLTESAQTTDEAESSQAIYRTESSNAIYKASRADGVLAQIRSVDRITVDSTLATTTSFVEGPRQVVRIFLDGDEAQLEVFTYGWTPLRPAFVGDGFMTGLATSDVEMGGTLHRVALLPRFLWDVLPGGSLALADSSSYSVKVIGPSGGVVRVLRRALPPRPVSATVRRAYRRQELDALSALAVERRRHPDPRFVDLSRGLDDMRLQAVEDMEFADEVPLVDDMRTAWDGTIWVRRTPEDSFPFDPSSDPLGVGGVGELQQEQVARDPAPIDVITSGGEYLGTLPAGDAKLPAAFGPGGVAAYIEVDALDVPSVLVGRLSVSSACESSSASAHSRWW